MLRNARPIHVRRSHPTITTRREFVSYAVGSLIATAGANILRPRKCFAEEQEPSPLTQSTRSSFDLANYIGQEENNIRLHIGTNDAWKYTGSSQPNRLIYFQGYKHPLITAAEQQAQICVGEYNPRTAQRFRAFVGPIRYEVKTPVMEPNVLASSMYSNNTDAAASEQFTDSKSTTATATWTVTNGISTTNTFASAITHTDGSSLTENGSVTANFTFFGLGGSANAGLSHTDTTSNTSSQTNTLSNNISLTNARSQSTSKTQTWSWNTSIPVPPRSKVTASVIVQEANVSTKFWLPLAFRGVLFFVVAIPTGYDDEEMHGFTAIDTVPWFKKLMSVKSIPFKVIKNKAGTEFIETSIDGVFSGAMGVNYIVQADQVDLDTSHRTRLEYKPK